MTATPLSASGRWIVDADGQRVKLAGVNWPGAHEDDMVPSGLDYRDRNEIARQIAEWGFNSVRLTFAVRTLTVASQANPKLLAANPDLAGHTPWGVFQAVVQALTGQGLIVIPNCHMLFSGWCCSTADNNGLWYNDNWPVSSFQSAWQTIATAFAHNPLVAAYDIKNEPRNATTGGTVRTPTWGDGNTGNDFRLMYQQTGNLIHQHDPDALIICEGLSYASSLTGVPANPRAADASGQGHLQRARLPVVRPRSQPEPAGLPQPDARQPRPGDGPWFVAGTTVARRIRCRQPVAIDSRPGHLARGIITVQRRNRELVAQRHSVAGPDRCGLVLLAPRRNPRQGNRTGHEPAHLHQGRPLQFRRVRTRLARSVVTIPTHRSSETATRKLRSKRRLTQPYIHTPPRPENILIWLICR